MGSRFETPITIKEAVDRITGRDFLLPAIQRRFIWKSSQIEMLFDSITRGYPINSFMFWEVRDPEIKDNCAFYSFLENYVEFFDENNLPVATKGYKDFKAVIDGQQRLTSLFIGLKGTYRCKTPHKKLADNENSMPTRKLYLNLSGEANLEYDNDKKYDFRFLSAPELAKLESSSPKENRWFEVGTILTFSKEADVFRYLQQNGLSDDSFATDMVVGLFQRINVDQLINYYLETEQDSEKVLDVFIRTNSGGTPLSFSDFLMSVASESWGKLNARKEMQRLINEIYESGNPGFRITKDFVLKTCLALSDKDIRFRLRNFTHDTVKGFEDNWEKMRSSIISAFELFEELGFGDDTFRAKNAAIPIIYYIYKNGLSEEITKPTYDAGERKSISRWLNLTFLKGIFGSQSDRVLAKMREVVNGAPSGAFPAQAIIEAFKTEPDHNYSFGDDVVEELLKSQYKASDATYLLMLLYPNEAIAGRNGVSQDHMHPKCLFEDKKRFSALPIPEEDRAFAASRDNWNSVLNLQLLDGLVNTSKGETPLSDWAKKESKSNRDLLLSDETSLDVSCFKAFIEDRRANIKKKLSELISAN